MTTKKSFLLMRDLLSTVDLMTDEEAGKILKSIINHVDGIPVKLSRDLTFAFTPIKNQLDRDMDKYDVFVDKQRKNGALGGRPKKNPKNPSLSKKTQKTQANPNNLVTDTVTVTATVNGTDNVTATDIKPYNIVAGLDVDAFDKFLAYRKEAGIKKLTKQGEQIAAKKLVDIGGNRQMEVVEQTIGNGWTGLFELKKQDNGKSKAKIDDYNKWLDEDDDFIEGECNVVN